jgi:hypothetical protein
LLFTAGQHFGHADLSGPLIAACSECNFPNVCDQGFVSQGQVLVQLGRVAVVAVPLLK